MFSLHLPHAILTSQPVVGASDIAAVAERVTGKDLEGSSRRPM